MNPVIQGFVRDASPRDRFVVLALAESLGEAKTQQIIDQIYDRGQDPTEIVAGRQFHFWMGKSAKQVENELGGDKKAFGEVRQAFANRNMQLAEPPKAEPTNAVDTPTPSPIPQAAPAPAADSDEGDEDTGDEEPTFGHDRIPASELSDRNLSDEQLLEINGIGQASLKKFREWEKANGK